MTIADTPWRGVMFMTATVTLQPVTQAIAKHLADELPVMEIVWGRFVVHCAIVVPIILATHGLAGLRPAKLGIQIVRGGMMCCATVFLVAALAFIPMADAIALVFIAPLVVTMLSPLVLGETVGPRRWAAVIVGFAGALIIIRPDAAGMEWAAIFALGSGVTYGIYLLVTRRVAGTAPAMVSLFHTALVAAIATSAVMPFVWVTPTLAALGWLVVSGMVSVLSHYCLIRAYHHSEASLLAPLSYGEIVTAALLGLFAFGDFPDAVTWIGVGVIALSGIYVSTHGRQVGAANRDGVRTPESGT